MPAQLNIFLLLFGGLQGLLFTLFMLRKKLYQSGYIYLLLYMGVILLQLTLKVMNKMWLMDNWSSLYLMSHYLPLLSGPLAYLFIKNFGYLNKQTSKASLHFLPFFFIALAIYLGQVDLIPAPIENVLYNPYFRLGILLFSLSVYHLLSYFVWQRLTISLNHHFYKGHFIQMRWLRPFILFSFITGLLVTTALYLLYIYYPYGHQYRFGFSGLTLFIYWISYSALKQPAIFSAIKGHAEIDNDHIPKLVAHKPVKKYASSTLDTNEKKRICEALNATVKSDKIYLDPELTMVRLAEKIKCSRHSLSQVINECMQQSFYEYINTYRVEEAKMLLADESRKDNKIASIGYDAGFNSLSTFNEVFKKLSGCTPSQFRRYPAEYSKRQRV